MVSAMRDDYADPSGNTAAFRAFVDAPEPVAAKPSMRLPLIIGAAVAVVVVAALALWLALGA